MGGSETVDMATVKQFEGKLPERIVRRLLDLEEEVDAVAAKVEAALTTTLPRPISFRFQHAAIGDVLTAEERAQSVSFVTRYENLPLHGTVELSEREGRWYIANMPLLRYVLNDYRPLTQNKRDADYYQNVHNTWYGFLQETDPSRGLSVRVLDTSDEDVTTIFSKWISERNRAITAVLRSLECDYLYNGILQHSDVRFAERFLKDYVSGELNYFLWKHMHAFDMLREMLEPYHRLLSILTFPKLGPL